MPFVNGIEYDNEGFPIVDAEIYIDKQKRRRVRFFCIYCNCYHYHGAGKIGENSSGHKMPHCHNPQSLYKTGKMRGYILRVRE